MVAIGGASEALLAAPGTMNLILNKRYYPCPTIRHCHGFPYIHVFATPVVPAMPGQY